MIQIIEMKKNLFVLLFYFLLTAIITYPLIFHMDNLIIDKYDGLLINWIINRVIYHPFSLDTNIFYPFQNTLAYSDFHLISALTAAPFVIIFRQPILASSINLFLGFTLTAFTTYLLVRQLTRDSKVAVLAGTLFSFGMIHMNYRNHLQLLGFWPFILTIYLFNRRNLRAFVVLFFLTVATMPLFFFFFLAYFVFSTKKDIKYVLASFTVSAVVFVPYFLVSRQFDYVRPITDAINFSLKFQTFLEPNINSRLGLFSGLSILFVLILIAIRKPQINRYFLLSIFSLVLALGPALHIFRNTIHVGPIPFIPLPYTIFYYLLPGFSGFRTPSRWILLSVFALIIGFSMVFRKKMSNKIIAALILITVIEINFPFGFVKVPKPDDFPAEQKWLESHFIGTPIVQFPIYGWFDKDKIAIETLRMHYSIYQNHPMVNGYSGFSPRSWEKEVQNLQKEFPSKESFDYLLAKKIDLVLVPRTWEDKTKPFSDYFTKVYQNKSVLIYRLSKRKTGS